MIVYLVRHGETAYNRDGLGLGRADVPLTPRGALQVAALAADLSGAPIASVFSSPLGRALVTAEAIAGGHSLDVERRDELLELDIGETEGLPFAEMRARYPDLLKAWAGPGGETAVMPGGESLADLAARLDPFAAELEVLDLPAVAVVSHNFVARALLCRLLGIELAAYRSFVVGLASYCTLEVRDGRVIVVNINHNCHLDALESRALNA